MKETKRCGHKQEPPWRPITDEEKIMMVKIFLKAARKKLAAEARLAAKKEAQANKLPKPL